MLWEELPGAVMDAACRIHHACLRRLLIKHRGYESATEVRACGDSSRADGRAGLGSATLPLRCRRPLGRSRIMKCNGQLIDEGSGCEASSIMGPITSCSTVRLAPPAP